MNMSPRAVFKYADSDIIELGFKKGTLSSGQSCIRGFLELGWNPNSALLRPGNAPSNLNYRSMLATSQLRLNSVIKYGPKSYVFGALYQLMNYYRIQACFTRKLTSTLSFFLTCCVPYWVITACYNKESRRLISQCLLQEMIAFITLG